MPDTPLVKTQAAATQQFTYAGRTNEDFDKIIVEGEGGLQEKKSQKLIRDAYKLVGKEIIIDIYKKTWVDGEMKDEEINERKKTKSSYRSSFRE